MRSPIDHLLGQSDPDGCSAVIPDLIEPFEQQLERALRLAYHGSGDWRSHLFLQQTLYRVNRLALFWADDLSQCEDQRSSYLERSRDWIEAEWQHWEARQIPRAALRATSDIGSALCERTSRDGQFNPTQRLRFFVNMTRAGYRRLLECSSLDVQLEAGQLARALGGLEPELNDALARLVFELPGGQPRLRQGTAFHPLLEYFCLSTRAEAYLESIPWEILALTNQRFVLVERKRLVLQLVGSLLYTQTSLPQTYFAFEQAAQELGLPASVYGYWTERIKRATRERRWLLEEVALPLVARYPEHAWELLWGYDQQSLMAERASEALAGAVREAQQLAEAPSNQPRALSATPTYRPAVPIATEAAVPISLGL